MPSKQFSIRWLLLATMFVALSITLCVYIYTPPSCAVAGDPKNIVEGLLPPVSKGGHYLKPSASSTQFVWLFGAYNNGRKEEHVLIENDGQKVRYRSYWLNSDGKLWCLDISLANTDWNLLLSELRGERADTLPNLVPNLSHGMTDWLELDAGAMRHEACIYGLDAADTFPLFRGDQRYAKNWKTIIDGMLQLRRNYPDSIRSASFSSDGTVDWGSSRETNTTLAEILKW